MNDLKERVLKLIDKENQMHTLLEEIKLYVLKVCTENKQYGKSKAIVHLHPESNIPSLIVLEHYLEYCKKHGIAKPLDVDFIDLSSEEKRYFSELSSKYDELENEFDNENSYFFNTALPELEKNGEYETLKNIFSLLPSSIEKFNLFTRKVNLFI